MTSYEILKAIRVNSAALAKTAYSEESMPYVGTLNNLFCTLKHALDEEKTALDAETSKAANSGNNKSPTEYTNADSLSSYEAGTRVITVDGHHGEIKNEIYGGVLVELDIGKMKRYEMWDLREEFAE
jgi:hypothetical protein